MQACQRWGEMVRQEHAQSDRMRGASPPPQDHWQPYAQQFSADPCRTDDPLLQVLLEQVAPHQVVMDVGAGAGRTALPLALKCRHIVAVEPSPSMAAAFLEQASASGIHNTSLVQSRWEEAQVDPVDVIICCHVLYVIADIDAFIRKMDAHAREKVLVVLYDAPPQSQVSLLWEQVHGERRLPLPSLPEFEDVLKEMDILPKISYLPPRVSRGYDSIQQAADQLAGRLFLQPGSAKISLLEEILPDVLEEVDGELLIRGARPLTPALIAWEPAG